MRRSILDFRALLGAFALACAAGAAAEGVRPVRGEARLRAEVSVAGSIIRLADVAELDGMPLADRARLSSAPLADAPRVGQVVEVTRARVRDLLPVGWHLGGAAVSRVTRATQELSAARLCQIAVAAATPHLEQLAPGASRSVTCLDAHMPPLTVAAGTVDLRPAVDDLQPIDGPQSVRLELRIGNRLERVLDVPLRIDLAVARWCATTALAEGVEISSGAFERCQRPVRHADDLRQSQASTPTGRLRLALRAGEALTVADVAAADELLAGDTVTVRLRNGAFELESPGVLIQGARVGAMARVRTALAASPVAGTLNERRVVELD